MAFTVQDYYDLVQLLHRHPEWRASLRELLLSDDILTLPKIVRELAEAQRRTEAQIQSLVEAQRRTEAQVQSLVEAQRRTEAQVQSLMEAQRRTEAQVQSLVEAQRRTEERVGRLEAAVEQLVEAQRRTDQNLAQLATDVRALATEVRNLAEWQRGEAGRREGERYARGIAKHAFVMFNGGQGGIPDQDMVYQHLLSLMQRVPNVGSLTEEQNPLMADIIWWKGDQYAVVEVSLVVDRHDIIRAALRAETLREAKVQAIGVVVGKAWADEDLYREASAQGVQWRVGDDVSEGYKAFCRLPA